MGRETSGRSAGPASSVVRDLRVREEVLGRRRRYRQHRRRPLRKTARIRHVVDDAVADGLWSESKSRGFNAFLLVLNYQLHHLKHSVAQKGAQVEPGIFWFSPSKAAPWDTRLLLTPLGSHMSPHPIRNCPDSDRTADPWRRK